MLQTLFEREDRYNLAEEVGALEIQKEVYEDWRLKDEQIEVLNKKIDAITKPVVFVEGEFDEVYFKKALEIFGKSDSYPADIKWIGCKDETGNSFFTVKDNLEKAEKFLEAQKPRQKTVLFYDVECNKTIRTVGNLTVYCPAKIPNAKYNTGTEHLLVVPDDFIVSDPDFREEQQRGDIRTIRPKKENIKNYVLNLSIEKQKLWLANVNAILEDIMSNYLRE
ncbi:MAG: hypothetical protein EXS59_02225 [Candidatus Taylorbacteria bacterium]|nr:hypothetical protein [Candidatus Taylorbacteria bacterium]